MPIHKAKATSIRLARGLRIFRTTYTGSDGEPRLAEAWYVEFRWAGRPRRLPAFTDKSASIDVARTIHRLVVARETSGQLDDSLRPLVDAMNDQLRRRLVQLGIIDPQMITATKALAAHLDGVRDADGKMIDPGFQQALEAKGNTPDYVQLTVGRVRRVLDGCGLIHWSDLEAPGAQSKIMAMLSGMRRPEEVAAKPAKRGNRRRSITAGTLNYYVTAIGNFCNWMVRDRRAKENPLAGMRGVQHADVDRKHERRALSMDELRCLLASLQPTPRGVDVPHRYGLTAGERELLYRFAWSTGLRPGQVRSLVCSSFDLQADPPTVTAAAAYVKRKTEHVHALQPGIAALLAGQLANKVPSAAAFKMPHPNKSATMLREDLAAARDAWIDAAGPDSKERLKRQRSDFLMYRDHHNKVADFYAIRHTTGSTLSEIGVPQTTIKNWLHHTRSSTTDRYMHTSRDGMAKAIAAFPDLATATAPEQAKATLGAFGGQSPDKLDQLGRSKADGSTIENAVAADGSAGFPRKSDGEKQRPRSDSNRRITDLQSVNDTRQTVTTTDVARGASNCLALGLAQLVESDADAAAIAALLPRASAKQRRQLRALLESMVE